MLTESPTSMAAHPHRISPPPPEHFKPRIQARAPFSPSSKQMDRDWFIQPSWGRPEFNLRLWPSPWTGISPLTSPEPQLGTVFLRLQVHLKQAPHLPRQTSYLNSM